MFSTFSPVKYKFVVKLPVINIMLSWTLIKLKEQYFELSVIFAGDNKYLKQKV